MTDRFDREVDDFGLTLVDWEGHIANPVIEFFIQPPAAAALPVTASLSADGVRLYFDEPSTTSASGPTKTLNFFSAVPQRVLISIAPDRDHDDERYMLTIEFNDDANTTRTLSLNVIDQDIDRANEFDFTLDFSADASGFFDNAANRDVLQQAADDWGYFIADMQLIAVFPGVESHFIWNWPLAWTGPFPNTHGVVNTQVFTGYHLWVYGVNTPEIRSGGEPSVCCFQSSGGSPLPLRRSGGVEIEIAGNYNTLGWNASLLDDDWWVTSLFGGEVADLYSVAEHEIGHAIAFDDRLPNFNDRQAIGFSSPALDEYYGGTVFVDPGPNHFAGVIDPASRKGAFGNEYGGEMPLRRWFITKLNLLLLEVIGYELRDTSSLRAVSVADSTFPPGFLDTPYDGSLVADGGIPFYDWTLEAGILPPGLAVDAFTGELVGTPTADGVFNFSLHLRDYSGGPGVVIATSVTILAVQIPPAPLPSPSDPGSRDLAIVLPNPSVGGVAPTGVGETALRVSLDSLYHPGKPFPVDPPDFSAREGEVRYVNVLRNGNGDPVTSCLSSPSLLTFYRCATVGCDPEYADWAGLFGGQAIHLSGASIIPDSTYSVAQLPISCAGSEASCIAASEDLVLTTARYGDVDASDVVSVTDVVLTVDVVKDVPGAAWEYQAYVRSPDPQPHNDSVNVTDIVLHVDALKLVAYPLTVSSCP